MADTEGGGTLPIISKIISEYDTHNLQVFRLKACRKHVITFTAIVMIFILLVMMVLVMFRIPQMKFCVN